MFERVELLVLYSAVAGVLVLALIRVWRIGRPSVRFALWLIPLALPVLCEVVLPPLLPFRETEVFRDGWALFSLSRWRAFRMLGLSADQLLFAAAASAGLLLYLRDAVPFLVAGRSPRAGEGAGTAPPGVGALVTELSRALSIPEPEVRYLDRPTPVLYCEGFLRPRLVVSRGAVAALDAEELRAALAHEMGHVTRKDPAFGWALLGVRTLLFFDPVAQLAARAAVLEAERDADERAVRLTGRPLVLASALARLHEAQRGRASPLPQWSAFARTATLLRQGRIRPLRQRLRRLIDGAPPSLPGEGLAQVVLAVVGLALLLSFVT